MQTELTGARKLFGRAGRSEYSVAREQRKLQRRRPDTAANGMHEHALPYTDVELSKQRVVRGEKGFGYRSGVGVRQVAWDREGFALVDA